MTENTYRDKLKLFSAEIPQDISTAPLPAPNSTKSFWLNPQSEVNPLANVGSNDELASSVDICIIGSGITGVSAALHLSRALPSGARVAILEAREFCAFVLSGQYTNED